MQRHVHCAWLFLLRNMRCRTGDFLPLDTLPQPHTAGIVGSCHTASTLPLPLRRDWANKQRILFLICQLLSRAMRIWEGTQSLFLPAP